MEVIQFTHGATDPLLFPGIDGAHFLPLADGEGDIHVGCVHLDRGATLETPWLTHATALLVVHGRLEVTVHTHGGTIRISGGMGCVFKKGEPYSLHSEVGAIVLIVEADSLTAHPRGIFTPECIRGQTWPSDALIPH